jgi:hypothetical protein
MIECAQAYYDFSVCAGRMTGGRPASVLTLSCLVGADFGGGDSDSDSEEDEGVGIDIGVGDGVEGRRRPVVGELRLRRVVLDARLASHSAPQLPWRIDENLTLFIFLFCVLVRVFFP